MTAPDFRLNPDRHCKGVHPNVMFPEDAHGVNIAKAICAGCPVIVECWQYAQDHHESWGVWGGQSIRGRIKNKRPDHAPIDHGSNTGYKMHGTRGEVPCRECIDAHSLYNAEHKRADCRHLTKYVTADDVPAHYQPRYCDVCGQWHAQTKRRAA